MRRVGAAGGLLLLLAAALLPGCAPARPAAPATDPAPAPAAAASQSAPTPTPAPLQKVTVAIPAISMPFLPYYVAHERGFDRRNGLELDTPLLVGRVGVQAMLAGGVDFSASAGTVLNARLNDAPLRVLMIGIDRSTYTLYTQPSVQSVGELAGKTVGIDSLGSSLYAELAVSVAKLGGRLSDITIVGISDDSRSAALQSGAVEGVVITPPRDVQLDRLGFRRLLDLGDYAVGINGGLGTTTALLETQPDLAERVATTALMGLRYIKENREGTLPLMQAFMDLDAETAALVYDRTAGSYSDGASTAETRAEIARHAAEALQLTSIPPLDEVYDLRPLTRANARLQEWAWQPR